MVWRWLRLMPAKVRPNLTLTQLFMTLWKLLAWVVLQLLTILYGLCNAASIVKINNSLTNSNSFFTYTLLKRLNLTKKVNMNIRWFLILQKPLLLRPFRAQFHPKNGKNPAHL